MAEAVEEVEVAADDVLRIKALPISNATQASAIEPSWLAAQGRTETTGHPTPKRNTCKRYRLWRTPNLGIL